MKYHSFSSISRAFKIASKSSPFRIRASLLASAKLIQTSAKSYIGKTSLDGWEPLEASTIERKGRLGVSGAGMLNRTGEMRDSIKIRANFFEAIIESHNRAMYYHETGTFKMPKRPVLTRAVFKNRKRIAYWFRKSVMPLIVISVGRE